MPMILAASVGLGPCSISFRACANRSGVSFTFRPNFTPRRCAAFTPARVLMHRRDRAADLLAMYRSWDDEMVRYKIASNNLAPGFIPFLEKLSAAT